MCLLSTCQSVPFSYYSGHCVCLVPQSRSRLGAFALLLPLLLYLPGEGLGVNFLVPLLPLLGVLCPLSYCSLSRTWVSAFPWRPVFLPLS